MSHKNENGIYVNYDKVSCDRYSFEGTADAVKSYIDSIVATANEKGMIGEGRFDFSMERGYYNEWECHPTYNFGRVETEKEKDSREKDEAADKARKAKARKKAAEKKKMKTDAEYAEFLRLKEKFKEVN